MTAYRKVLILKTLILVKGNNMVASFKVSKLQCNLLSMMKPQMPEYKYKSTEVAKDVTTYFMRQF